MNYVYDSCLIPRKLVNANSCMLGMGNRRVAYMMSGRQDGKQVTCEFSASIAEQADTERILLGGASSLRDLSTYHTLAFC